MPDKDVDGTGEEGGAGESTSPEEEDEETADAGQEENVADALVQDLLTWIDALPDAEEYLAAEPDVEDEDAYAAWEEKLYEHAKEALSIMEEYIEFDEAYLPTAALCDRSLRGYLRA